MNRLLLDALAGHNKSGRPPVWLMRQAGRYMAEYRQLRERHSFLSLCQTPALATEVTLQPVRAYGPDAAILFSDILLILEALGHQIHYDTGSGPIIDPPLTPASPPLPGSAAVIDQMAYVSEAIALLIDELTIPLLGFAGAPFTLASYLIEGGSSRTLRKTKQWMLRDPESFHVLLDQLADCIIASLQAQISAGVAAVQLFDSWAHTLAPRQFAAFSLRYIRKITAALSTPTIFFCKSAAAYAAAIAEALPGVAISLDWNGDVATIRHLVGNQCCLQGNLDPAILDAPPAFVARECRAILQRMDGDPAYIFNLGHGIMPATPVESVAALFDTVKGWSAR